MLDNFDKIDDKVLVILVICLICLASLAAGGVQAFDLIDKTIAGLFGVAVGRSLK